MDSIVKTIAALGESKVKKAISLSSDKKNDTAQKPSRIEKGWSW